MEMGEYASLV